MVKTLGNTSAHVRHVRPASETSGSGDSGVVPQATPGSLAAKVDPLKFYSIAEVAALCHRSEKTVRNLISEQQLPRKLGWAVRRRHRQRVMLLRAETVAHLQSLTLFRERSPR